MPILGEVSSVWKKLHAVENMLNIHVKKRYSQSFLNGILHVTRQIHEGEYSNWLHKTILRLSHLFQVS